MRTGTASLCASPFVRRPSTREGQDSRSMTFPVVFIGMLLLTEGSWGEERKSDGQLEARCDHYRERGEGRRREREESTL